MTNVVTCPDGPQPASLRLGPAPILDDCRFHHLVKSRRKFSWTLAASMLAAYFAFILLIAFAPGVLGTPILAGHPTTWGILVGLGMLVFTFGLVGIYVYRANTVYDARLESIRREERS